MAGLPISFGNEAAVMTGTGAWKTVGMIETDTDTGFKPSKAGFYFQGVNAAAQKIRCRVVSGLAKGSGTAAGASGRLTINDPAYSAESIQTAFKEDYSAEPTGTPNTLHEASVSPIGFWEIGAIMKRVKPNSTLAFQVFNPGTDVGVIVTGEGDE